jgi:hypothetical protein
MIGPGVPAAGFRSQMPSRPERDSVSMVDCTSVDRRGSAGRHASQDDVPRGSPRGVSPAGLEPSRAVRVAL